MDKTEKSFDFVVVGAGVTGAWVSYELSKRKCTVCVLEKESDSCEGTSKANSAIVHAGYDPEPGTLMARLNVRGNEIIRGCHERMAIPFRQVGSIVAAFDDDGVKSINDLYARGRFNGVEGLRILSREETLALEKGLGDDVKASLFAPTGGICSPFELTAAPLEIAIKNGVEFRKNTELKTVEKKDGRFILNGDISCSVVINCAGVDSGRVASIR